MIDRFMRMREVIDTTGLSRSTIWRLETAGKFPTRQRIADRAVAWRESTIQAWMRARRLAGAEDDLADKQ